MQNHPSIRYVTQGDVFSIDTFPFPQYPLGNVIITNATFDGKSTDYGVQIVVADKIKLKDNESSGSNNQQTIYFEGVDDTVDIHANTLSIVNDLLSYTDRKEEGFEIQGTTACTAFKQEYDNGLAGWSADFTLRVHNDRNICLFDLGKSTTQECIRFTFAVLGGDPVIIEYRDCNGDVQYQYNTDTVCGLEVISLSDNTVIGSQQPCE
tara:strand:- start:246 stop:869 length:624 start_codon:yes stop_codon:yes gene_type:complete